MILRFLILIITVSAASTASAQWINNKAATAGESYARGVSDITRARAQASIDYSKSRLIDTESRSRELDNHLKTGQTFYEMRRMTREAKFGTPEEKYEKKIQNEQRFAAQVRKRKQNVLTDEQLDPLTGEINWPSMLMDPSYDAYRANLEDLFATRARYDGQLSYEASYEIESEIKKFRKALKANLDKLGDERYLAGVRFLRAMNQTIEN